MKANEAPEKIYITNFDIEALPKDEQLSEHWHEVSTQDADIEYTRTDAFIEKACEWLEIHTFSELNLDFGHFLEIREFVDRFKDYMKGE